MNPKTESLPELEARLVHLIQQREGCLVLGAVEDACRVAQQIAELKQQIQERQNDRN